MKTKKQKIIDIFNSKEWINNVKIITGEDFDNVGLSDCIEFGTKYNNIIYAKRILKKMGYNVNIGHSMYINKKL